MMQEYFRSFARYNAWANRILYAACDQVPDDAYYAIRPAFFGSIHGTLNHLLVGDRIWLARLRGEPPVPLKHATILHEDRGELRAAREREDAGLIALSQTWTDERIVGTLDYCNMAGAPFTTPLSLVLCHFFNHQTHHRGQVHGLLSATEVAPPELDYIIFQRQDAG